MKKYNSGLVDWRKVWAIWLRHFTVYKTTWLVNFIPPVTEPLFYLFGFGLGLSPIIGRIEYQGVTISYLNFIAPGMVAIAALFQSFVEAGYGGFVRFYYQRTWQALMTAPLTFNDLFFGELVWAATKGTLAASVTALVVICTGLAKIADLALLIPLIILASFVFGAVGMLTVGLISKIDEINLPLFLFVIPMSILAGTYYPRSNLPPEIEWAINCLPLSALVDLMRFNLAPYTDWWKDILLLAVWLLVTVALAYASLYRKLFK
ncbi:MAG: ABC transporter permease [Candidatus Caenarcaniphilales bacterium]|nr:ABC transporter permease [Candidatus Caenarcaniphilales bacterium]